MIYQDPLAYLLGLEGIALLYAWAGDHDRAFTDAQLAEVRRLLDDEKLRGRGVLAERVSTVTAYRQWSAGYAAEAGGGLFAMDEPVVDVIVCALALVHVPRLQPVLAEFARCCAVAGTWSFPTCITSKSPAAR